VRLIGETGEQLGVVPIKKALEVARDHGLDLVEVAATSNPPVCRILDYGRYRYEQTKKERKARQGQRTALKEIRIKPRVQEHDLETKIRLAKRMLEEGDNIAGIDGSPSLDGRIMHLVLTPISAKQIKTTKVKEEGSVAKT
jgi:translation initiation factor IF-3